MNWPYWELLNVKVSAESLEKTVEQQVRATQQSIDEMRNDVERWLGKSQDETAFKVRATRDEISVLVEARSAEIMKHLRSTQRELGKTQSELDNFRERGRRQTMSFAIAIVVVLGLAVFALIHSITRTNDADSKKDGSRPANVAAEPNGAAPRNSHLSHQPSSPLPSHGDWDVSEPRTWTDNTGRTTEAIFVAFDGENVQLKKADGKVYTISIDQLDEKDQAIIRQHFPRQ